MPTIEKKPLPPIGSGVVTINPSDREDIMGRARDVIDHYMSGRGSWWDEGPRKSAQQTIDDLNTFRESVIAAEQYLDDPGSVWPSVKQMIEAAIERTGHALPNLENTSPSEIQPSDPRDAIMRATPPTVAPPTKNGKVQIFAAPMNPHPRAAPAAIQPDRVPAMAPVVKAPGPDDPDFRVLRRVVRD